MSRTIKASEVRKGMAVSAVTCEMATPLLRRTYISVEHLRRHRGQWPTVVATEYLQAGEGGQPTVYITVSDDTGSCYALGLDSKVTVEERS